MKPCGHGGRARDVTGHAFHTLAPVPQPSTTHAPETVAWHPGPQPSAAAAGTREDRKIADKTANPFMRSSSSSEPLPGQIMGATRKKVDAREHDAKTPKGTTPALKYQLGTIQEGMPW